MTQWRVLAAPAVLAAMSLAQAAYAQPAAAQQPAAALPAAGFQDGFFVQSANGDYRLLFGMVAQTDGRFSTDDPTPVTDTFTIRKVRPTFSGRVARYFDFKVMPDFGNGTTTITDAYFDIRFSPKFRIRTGKDKTPVGYELLVGDAFLLFPERSLASSLVPNRDIGVQVQGDLGSRFYYGGGVYNGVADGASSSTDVDTNNAKDLAGRIVVQPFRTSTAAAAASPLTGLGFQIGGSTGNQIGALPGFRTSAGQTYFSYATGTTADGRRTRITPSVFYYYKAFGAFAEYVRSTQDVTRGAGTNEFTNTAWNATASLFLTGEAASVGITRPGNAFDPQAGKWGALQLVARYAALDLDDGLIAGGFAGPGAANKATTFAVGVNWYPASVVKYYLNYERTEFDTGTAPERATENIVLFRVQLGI
jgi:phosphate-selective porin OprO/OprP